MFFRKALIALLIVASGTGYTENQESYVSCNVMGQLGNQLFEIATTLSYAWDYGATPIFPELNQDNWRKPYNRDQIFFRLDTSTPLPAGMESYSEPDEGSSEKIPFKPNLFLHGYLQSWKRFHHHRDQILAMFAPSPFYLEEITKKYSHLLNHPNTVSIHVRASCRRKHEGEGFTFVGMDYYERAVTLFPEDALFVVFSDRIDWCKHHFECCKNVVFIEGNNHIMDLFLMSMMKHHIIGNSTFSWWGAYLNANPDKIVVAPYPWNHAHLELFPKSKEDFFPSDWIILPISKHIQYPEDMEIHSSGSLSFDCNE